MVDSQRKLREILHTGQTKSGRAISGAGLVVRLTFSLGLGNFSDRSDFLGLSLGLVLGLLGHWGSSSLLIFLFDCHHYVFVCEY